MRGVMNLTLSGFVTPLAPIGLGVRLGAGATGVAVIGAAVGVMVGAGGVAPIVAVACGLWDGDGAAGDALMVDVEIGEVLTVALGIAAVAVGVGKPGVPVKAGVAAWVAVTLGELVGVVEVWGLAVVVTVAAIAVAVALDV